jgi:DNA-binding transcriptional regulator YiaG
VWLAQKKKMLGEKARKFIRETKKISKHQFGAKDHVRLRMERAWEVATAALVPTKGAQGLEPASRLHDIGTYFVLS